MILFLRVKMYCLSSLTVPLIIVYLFICLFVYFYIYLFVYLFFYEMLDCDHLAIN